MLSFDELAAGPSASAPRAGRPRRRGRGDRADHDVAFAARHGRRARRPVRGGLSARDVDGCVAACWRWSRRWSTGRRTPNPTTARARAVACCAAWWSGWASWPGGGRPTRRTGRAVRRRPVGDPRGGPRQPRLRHVGRGPRPPNGGRRRGTRHPRRRHLAAHGRIVTRTHTHDGGRRMADGDRRRRTPAGEPRTRHAATRTRTTDPARRKAEAGRRTADAARRDADSDHRPHTPQSGGRKADRRRHTPQGGGRKADRRRRTPQRGPGPPTPARRKAKAGRRKARIPIRLLGALIPPHTST